MQKVMVTNDGVTTCITVEPDRFDDVALEAATRLIERNRNTHGFRIEPTMQCCIGKQVRNYNTYWVLVNAARYDAAEVLRNVVLKKTKIDLAQQPYHGGDIKLDAYA